MGERLCDVGERKLLRGLIRKHCQVAGDDCAVLSVALDSVVVTTDPAPPPAAKVIGADDDPYWMGWLLVTINASDLAASPENSWRVPIPVQTQEPPCGTSAVLTTTCATTEALA